MGEVDLKMMGGNSIYFVALQINFQFIVNKFNFLHIRETFTPFEFIVTIYFHCNEWSAKLLSKTYRSLITLVASVFQNIDTLPLANILNIPR